MDIIATYPSVIYKVLKTDGEMLDVDNPVFLPDPSVIDHIEEPYVKAFIICPNENIGDMMQLVMEKRGSVAKTDSHRYAPRDVDCRNAAERDPGGFSRQD